MNGESVTALIQKAYDHLKGSGPDAALAALDEALGLDFEHPEVLYAQKCLKWWMERLKRLEDFTEPYDQGAYILSQWRSFHGFLEKIGPGFEQCRYAVRLFVYSKALESFRGLLGDTVNEHAPALLLQVGRCHKGVGSYDEALKYLEQAGRFQREDGQTLSELADVYALLEETRMAKAYFREAFYADPQGVDLYSMESELIIRLADKVREQGLRLKKEGYSGKELLEWIPVEGCLLGVFSVKRELKGPELGKLKQVIFSLENEMRGSGQQDLLKPRLLNRYFWLIDHYEHVREDPLLIEQTMLKIKIIDPGVYERYRN